MQWRLSLDMQLKPMWMAKNIRGKWIVFVFRLVHFIIFFFWLLIFYNWKECKKIKGITFHERTMSKSNTQITWSRQWSLRIKKKNIRVLKLFPPPSAFGLLYCSAYLSAIYFYTIKHNYSVNNDDNKKLQ